MFTYIYIYWNSLLNIWLQPPRPTPHSPNALTVVFAGFGGVHLDYFPPRSSSLVLTATATYSLWNCCHFTLNYFNIWLLNSVPRPTEEHLGHSPHTNAFEIRGSSKKNNTTIPQNNQSIYNAYETDECERARKRDVHIVLKFKLQ